MAIRLCLEADPRPPVVNASRSDPTNRSGTKRQIAGNFIGDYFVIRTPVPWQTDRQKNGAEHLPCTVLS